jgi:hypothetical protein
LLLADLKPTVLASCSGRHGPFNDTGVVAVRLGLGRAVPDMRAGEEVQEFLVQRVEEESEVFLGILLKSALKQVSWRAPGLSSFDKDAWPTHPHTVKPLVLLHRVIHVLRDESFPPRVALGASRRASAIGKRLLRTRRRRARHGRSGRGVPSGRNEFAEEDDPEARVSVAHEWNDEPRTSLREEASCEQGPP